MKNIIALFVILFFITTPTASAHPGRTDANGGHTCRTNCEKWGLEYGQYHYHNGGSSTGDSTATAIQPAQPTSTPLPVVKQQTLPTDIPVVKSIATAGPYKETEMDKQKLFKVIRVIDGDTLLVSMRGKNEKVRLLGIDTPETVDPRKAVQCFGKEASAKLAAFVNGKYIKLVDDPSQGNRDTYGRLLRYVYLNDPQKTFVNGEMVKQGYAFSYKKYPTKYLEKFNRFENQAKNNNVGLWKACR